LVSCFATNIARVASIGRAAAATGRQVALSGRSLRRNEEIARELGLMDGVRPFLKEPSHLRGLDRREMVLICTGAQGEQNASLAKYAAGENWRLPEVHQSDTVVHSARVIPGNEQDLYSIFDKLRSKRVRILEKEYRGSPLHVTGHAVGNEIATMYDLVRPRFSIPVHGEEHHMEAHADIAMSNGVEQVCLPKEGTVFAINQQGIRKVAHLKIDLVAERSGVERGTFVPWDSNNPEAVYEHFETSLSPMVA
jgi:ribonuclease J